uniref:Phosphatidic acid phosphatase type 2/haloperoxidase domain-containing protein n=1 Tax=Trieres chinensis TaxID=1514140 RepID=A0A7S2EA90_TRICV
MGVPAKLLYGRLVLFALILVATLFFVFGGSFLSKPRPLTPYLCNTTINITECLGPDDTKSCADFPDPINGDFGVDCVPSACGRKVARGFHISVSGVNTPPGPLVGHGTPTDVKSGFMIFWSFVPYAMGVIIIASFIWAMDTCSLFFLMLLGIVAVVNEFILKKIMSQSRPTGSCLYFDSHGMPSGHSAISIGILFYSILEIFIDRPGLSLRKKTALFSAVVFFLAPVPRSRIYLSDHTRSQVGAGAAEGIVMAALWFLFLYKFALPRIDGWIGFPCFRWLGLRNTYRNGECFCPDWSPLCGRRAIENCISTGDGAKNDNDERRVSGNVEGNYQNQSHCIAEVSGTGERSTLSIIVQPV